MAIWMKDPTRLSTAESHVDRSIASADESLRNAGTQVRLMPHVSAAVRWLHISTDEVMRVSVGR